MTVVVRGLALLVVVWQALWIVADPRLWPGASATSVGTAAGWLAGVTWAALLAAYLLGRPTVLVWAGRANVVALVAYAVLRTLDGAGALQGLAGDGGLFVLAAGAAGFLLTTRGGIAIAGLTVSAEAAFVVGASAAGGISHAESLGLLLPLFALAAGAASIGARWVLLVAAERADEADEQSRQAEGARERADFVAEQLRDKERRLHETVLNTLVAISRGGLSATPEGRARISARCWESAGVLRDFLNVVAARPERTPAGTAAGAFASVVADARALGIAVSVDVGALDDARTSVRYAVVVAAREAVLNAIRHASATEVTVRARRSRSGRVRVDVVDNGIGFDPARMHAGFGLATAVVGGMEAEGGSARVESTPGQGTRVVLEWDPQIAPSQGLDLSGFVVPLLASFGIYCVAALALSWKYLAHPGLAALALVTLAVTDVLLVRRIRHGGLPWWAVLVALGGGAAIFLLQERSGLGVPWQDDADWGSAAVISVFLVLAALGPRGSFLVVLGAWLLLQGDPLRELLSAGTAILVAGALFGRSMRRMTIRLDAARGRVRRAEAEELAAQDVAVALQRRYLGLDASPAIALLEAIADGRLTADEPATMARAGREEAYLRKVLRVDPSLSPIHSLIAGWARTCHAREVELSVSVPEVRTGIERVDPAVVAWSAVFAAVVPRTQARLTLQQEDGIFVLRVVAQVDRGAHGAMVAMGGIDVDQAEGIVMMWEARLEAGVASGVRA